MQLPDDIQPKRISCFDHIHLSLPGDWQPQPAENDEWVCWGDGRVSLWITWGSLDLPDGPDMENALIAAARYAGHCVLESARKFVVSEIEIEFERKRHLLKMFCPDRNDDSKLDDIWTILQPSPDRLDMVRFKLVRPVEPGGSDDGGSLVEWLDNEIYHCEIGPPSASDPA